MYFDQSNIQCWKELCADKEKMIDKLLLQLADQRSRDRLMLAGQIAAALLANPAPWDKELNTVELRMAHVFRNVDALLTEHERTKETPDGQD